MANNTNYHDTRFVDIHSLPVEVLEKIFANLPSIVDQIALTQVCHFWREIVLGLRQFNRKRKTNINGRQQPRKNPMSTVDRHVYVRLPVAGSLNEGHGNEGFAVIFQLQCNLPILLCGVSIFLPHPSFIKASNAPVSRKQKGDWCEDLMVTVLLHEHATAQIGPIGEYWT